MAILPGTMNNPLSIFPSSSNYIYEGVQDQPKVLKMEAIFIDFLHNAKTPYLQEDDIWVIIRNGWIMETNKDNVLVQYFVGPEAKKYYCERNISIISKEVKGFL